MTYHFTPITGPEARTIMSWRYPFLDTLFDPDPDELEDDVAALLVPAYHYFAARNDDGELVGFCCFGEDAQVPGGDYTRPALDLGMGLRPELTGQGRSHLFLQAAMAWGGELFAPEYYRATIAAINGRSLAMCARAGFFIIQRFRAQAGEPEEFIVLLKAWSGADA
jgi:RimJ/RimL family protein N-acetyltransferase